MKKRQGLMIALISSYWKVFRLFFIAFSLYLLQNVFYRWDGFKYYSSFSEFLPNVALITLLWTIIAFLTSLSVWLLVKVIEWFCLQVKLKITIAHLWTFIVTFVFLSIIAWVTKRHFIFYGTTLLEKLIVILCLAPLSAFLTWLFRNKADKWIDAIQARISPLVWVFSIWFILSVPLMAYNMGGKQIEWRATSQKVSQSYVSDDKRPNIIFVTFDALTARNMSSYGYHRETTPFISEWAKKGSIFTRFYSGSNLTLPTTASLMTGKRLWTHQAYSNIEGASAPLRVDKENVALVLRENGYYTMKFVANYMASELLRINSSFDISPYYNEFHNPTSLSSKIDNLLFELFGNKFRLYNWLIKADFAFYHVISLISENLHVTEVPPEKAFNSFLSLIGNDIPTPFFAWIHLLPPHTPYLPPEPYLGMFTSSISDIKKMRNLDFKEVRYDEFIRYCDKQLGAFIKQLSMKNKLADTVIILSSDHGEGFEQRADGHGHSHLYEQVTNIPLIIKEPGQSEKRIISDLVEQIDIPATLLDLAHVSIPKWMEGRSLVPLMRGISLASKPIFSMSLGANPRGHQITKGTIAVWDGDYKLMHYLDENKSLLFNLRNDPDEKNNLFNKEHEVSQRLLSLIKENLKKANDKISRGDQ